MEEGGKCLNHNYSDKQKGCGYYKRNNFVIV